MVNVLNNLNDIAEQVASCKRCDLYKYATRAVPGEGNSKARVVFIGEGPGYWEDQKGIPFCGQSGKLLDELLQSIKLEREDVFIGNVVKHRPPQNRDPLPNEIEACSIWLDQQIKIIDPKVIVTLGRFSMTKFFPGEFISRIHGTSQMIFWNDRRLMIMPMYHPAAALRNGVILKELKTDFLKLGDLIK